MIRTNGTKSRKASHIIFHSQKTSGGYSTDNVVIEDEYYDTVEEQPAPPLLDAKPTETEDWDDDIYNGGSTFSIALGFSKEGELPREEDFYTLKLGEDKIILVDDIGKLKKAMSVLFKVIFLIFVCILKLMGEVSIET